MTDYYIKYTNPPDFDSSGTAEDIEYHFDLIQNLNDEGEIDALRVKGSSANQNIYMSFLPGKGKTIPIEWLLQDNGNDKSSGTFSSAGISDPDISDGTVVTALEQKIFFENYIFDDNNDSAWELYGGEYSDPDRDGTDEGTNVVILNKNIQRISDRPNVFIGRVDLGVGQRV